MSVIENRLEEMGIKLPQCPTPVANYVIAQCAGDLLFFSGAGPMKNGKPIFTGRLGEDLTIEEGYTAAREAGFNLISALKKEIGDLDRVEQIVKLLGFVSGTSEFHDQPAVINGVSDLMVEVFGDKGRHARSALGTNALPLNMPVEVEMIVRIRPQLT